MSMTRTVVVAHAQAFVRDRFAGAVSEAGHHVVLPESAAELIAAMAGRAGEVDLVVVDLALDGSAGADLVREVRLHGGDRVPVLVFGGSIADADEVRTLAPLGIAGFVNEYAADSVILPCLLPHLFPDNFNRRSSPRVNVAVAVTYRQDQAVASALTLDIGRGGLAVRTMSPVAVGSEVGLRFRLPGSTHEIDVVARVCWTDRQIGMGMQFERLTTADQAAIDEFVDVHTANETLG